MLISVVEDDEWICKVIGFLFNVFWLIWDVVFIVLVWELSVNCDGFFLNEYVIFGEVLMVLIGVLGVNFFWIWNMYCWVEVELIIR